MLTSTNPSTGEQIIQYQTWDRPELNKVISDCDESFKTWRQQLLDRRINLLKSLKQELINHKKKLAEMITLEIGKPITASSGEVDKCVLLCDYYLKNIEGFLAPKYVKTDMQKSYVSYHPLGVIYAIMPWNFPLWQVMRFAIPNITAGNVGVLKHAPNCTGMSLLTEEIFIKAGYPKNIFRSLLIDIELSPYVIQHPKVRAVTLTGSERAGKAVAENAGSVLKKVVLELGGSDPYIVLADADLEHAAKTITNARLVNTGQVCISAKRIILEKSISEKFKKLVLEEIKNFVSTNIADPMNLNCKLGPMARDDLRHAVHQQVTKTIEMGAELLLGGEMPDKNHPGFYYPITVLDNIPENSPAYSDEIFGPVFAFFTVDSQEQAIELANNTRFGLGAAVFTQDIKNGEYIANNLLRAGSCCVNTAVSSNPALPFGGIYNSGYGRELSCEGLYEFMNVKTVNIK